MSYKVTSPLVIVSNGDGVSGQGYFYEDGVIPAGFNDERCEQLVEDGMLEKVSDSTDSDSGKPAKSASKDEWVQYAIAQGLSEEAANAATKDELVKQYS